MSLSNEEDKRISAELGVTPGEWRPVLARTNRYYNWRVFCDREDKLVAYSCLCEGDARLMAKSKEMYALLKRTIDLLEPDSADCGVDGCESCGILADARAILDELK